MIMGLIYNYDLLKKFRDFQAGLIPSMDRMI